MTCFVLRLAQPSKSTVNTAEIAPRHGEPTLYQNHKQFQHLRVTASCHHPQHPRTPTFQSVSAKKTHAHAGLSNPCNQPAQLVVAKPYRMPLPRSIVTSSPALLWPGGVYVGVAMQEKHNCRQQTCCGAFYCLLPQTHHGGKSPCIISRSLWLLRGNVHC